MTEDARRGSFVGTAAATYATNAGVALLSLANVLLVARVLGPEGRGDVAFLITVTTLTALVGALGIQEANANLGGLRGATRSRLATNSLVFAVGFGGAAAGTVALAVVAFPAVGGEVPRPLLLATLAGVPVTMAKTYLTALAQSRYDFAATNAAWLLGPVTTLVGNTCLASTGHLGVASAIGLWLGGQALGTALLVVRTARRDGFAPPDGSLAREALAFGSRTHGGRVLALGNYRLDQWLVGSIAGSHELGLYSVAVAWAEALFYLAGVLVMVQRPDLVRADDRRAGLLAARVFRAALVLAAPVVCGLLLLAPLLCTAVFGAAFAGSVDDLRVLALGAFGIVALELLGSALNARGRPLVTTGAVAVAFVTTIVLDALLIPRLGGLGAAVATSAAWTAGGAVVAVAFARALAVPAGALVPRPVEVARYVATRGRVPSAGEAVR